MLHAGQSFSLPTACSSGRVCRSEVDPSTGQCRVACAVRAHLTPPLEEETTRGKAKTRGAWLNVRITSNHAPTPPSRCHSRLCTPRVPVMLQAAVRVGLRTSLSRLQPLRGIRGHWSIMHPTTIPLPAVFQPKSRYCIHSKCPSTSTSEHYYY